MTTHPMDEHYRELAAGIVFRLRQLADEIETESSDHIAASLAAEWGDTTHGVMELLQQAEGNRTHRFVLAMQRRNADALRPATQPNKETQ